MRSLTVTTVLAIFIFITLIFIVRWKFGSLDAALAIARGERLLVDAHRRSVGLISTDQTAVAEFRVTNVSGRPITLLGVRLSCTCLTANPLPVTLAPGEIYPLSIVVRGKPNKTGEFEETLNYFTDDPTHRNFVLKVAGSYP